ncbi:MAG: metal-dependent hydrolase, partial [Acidobacteria bacterium]|nr:metal-dependent hydrolase [Acidobacteriota bacterium]
MARRVTSTPAGPSRTRSLASFFFEPAKTGYGKGLRLTAPASAAPWKRSRRVNMSGSPSFEKVAQRGGCVPACTFRPVPAHARSMDNLTHSLTGLLLARAGLDRLTPRAHWVLLAAANAPDLDVVSAASGALAYLQYHRHGTHSLALLPLMALLGPVVVRVVSR